MKLQALVFDAYGTLFDVHSVVMRAGSGISGDLHALSTLWRQKQLEYTWLRSLMERYEDFWNVTEAALHSAIVQLKIEASDTQLDRLMQAFLTPAAFPDVIPALDALKGIPMAILSNGSPRMLESAVHDADLTSCFAEIISVDQAKTYKPSPRVYALAPGALNVPREEILFVSSNSWDAAGAKAFGFKVCWCNRSQGNMEHLGFSADVTIHGLGQVADYLSISTEEGA
jgi:2-haloacid dehalogenase